MKIKLPLVFVMSVLVAGTLAGCTPTAAQPSRPPTAKAPAAAGPDAKTASISLGTVVVDGSGHTAYFFDHDSANSGKSDCTGGCSATWPAITSASKAPTVTGITGTVATIPAADGKFQITINGLPIYTFAGDSAAGDSSGQGVGGIWWVASSTGTEIK